jgi:SAM-dependent methyltransferase
LLNRQILYDRPNDRLVYLAEPPTQAYWDSLWATLLTKDNISRGDRFVAQETRRVLDKGCRVIDAGCGRGATVYGLAKAGFEAYGVDYAERTVATILGHFPDLKIRVADVRNMPYPDEWFDGLWSLGVIEHFFDGYDSLIAEAHRLLRPGGYLFLTVPSISPLKSLKIAMNHYAEFEPSNRDHFFQFAFRPAIVARTIEAQGFRLVYSQGRTGSLGLSEDIGRASRFVLPDPGNRSLWARAWWRGVDRIVRPFTYHIRYFLFRRGR